MTAGKAGEDERIHKMEQNPIGYLQLVSAWLFEKRPKTSSFETRCGDSSLRQSIVAKHLGRPVVQASRLLGSAQVEWVVPL